jgi:hypothetical protein
MRCVVSEFRKNPQKKRARCTKNAEALESIGEELKERNGIMEIY